MSSKVDSTVQELIKVLINQRDTAMTKAAELEANLIIARAEISKHKNEEQAEYLFKSKDENKE